MTRRRTLPLIREYLHWKNVRDVFMKKRPVMIEGKLRMWRVYVDIQAAQAVTHVSHRIIVTQYRALWIPPLLECDPKSFIAFLMSLEYPTVLYRGTLYLLLEHHFPTRFIEPSVDWGLSLIRSSWSRCSKLQVWHTALVISIALASRRC